jgi:5-azacytidine-induced protein 1
VSSFASTLPATSLAHSVPGDISQPAAPPSVEIPPEDIPDLDRQARVIQHRWRLRQSQSPRSSLALSTESAGPESSSIRAPPSPEPQPPAIPAPASARPTSAASSLALSLDEPTSLRSSSGSTSTLTAASPRQASGSTATANPTPRYGLSTDDVNGRQFRVLLEEKSRALREAREAELDEIRKREVAARQAEEERRRRAEERAHRRRMDDIAALKAKREEERLAKAAEEASAQTSVTSQAAAPPGNARQADRKTGSVRSASAKPPMRPSSALASTAGKPGLRAPVSDIQAPLRTGEARDRKQADAISDADVDRPFDCDWDDADGSLPSSTSIRQGVVASLSISTTEKSGSRSASAASARGGSVSVSSQSLLAATSSSSPETDGRRTDSSGAVKTATPSAPVRTGGAPQLKSILDYLDQLERNAEEEAVSLTLSSVTSSSASTRSPAPVSLQQTPAAASRAGAGAGSGRPSSVASEANVSASPAPNSLMSLASANSIVHAHQAAVQQHALTIDALKKAMQQQRERFEARLKEQDKAHQQQLAELGREQEVSTKRHLSFVDQLLEDKRKLSDKCETIVQEMKSLESKLADRNRVAQEHLERELRLQRERLQAAEKARRDQWMAEQTKRIKEMTIKGLEPDVQRIVTQHKKELQQVEMRHAEEMRKRGEEIQAAADERIAQLRMKAADDVERACDHEREQSRQRYERQVAELEEELARRRRRMELDIAADKARSEDGLKQRITELEEMLEQAERRHRLQMQRVRDEVAVEREEWLRVQHQALAKQGEEELGALRERMKRERDQEIDMVINRLERETSDARMYAEEQAGVKWRAQIAQVESELNRVREELGQRGEELLHTAERLQEAQARVRGVEGELLAEREHKRTLVSELDRLKAEKSQVFESARHAAASQVQQLEAAAAEAREQLSHAQAEHERELVAVQDRVRAAVSKKVSCGGRVLVAGFSPREVVQDEIVRGLQERLAASEFRIAQLEELLQQQREEFLKLGSV